MFRNTLLMALGSSTAFDGMYALSTETGRLYRKTHEFSQRIRKAGIFDYWQEHGFPSMCRPVGADDFACD